MFLNMSGTPSTQENRLASFLAPHISTFVLHLIQTQKMLADVNLQSNLSVYKSFVKPKQVGFMYVKT